MDTRITLAEQIQEYVNGNSDRSRDEKLDIREVFARMDQVANAFARIGRLERMKEGVQGVDNCYFTFFPDIEVKELGDRNSMVKLPANFMQLTHNRGIKIRKAGSITNYYIPVTQEFAETQKYSIASRLEGNVSFFVQYRNDGPYAIFTTPIHKTDNQVDKVDIQLAIVDSSVVNDNAPYPIDPQWTKDFITEVATFFLGKSQVPTDEVNNSVTKPENK